MLAKIKFDITLSPSRFYLDFDKNEYIATDTPIEKRDGIRLFNVYLGSLEPIELDCLWHLVSSNEVSSDFVLDTKFWNNRDTYKKIIFSSDPNLKEGGVQELSTGFLRWYANERPGWVEWVEVEKVGSIYKLIY